MRARFDHLAVTASDLGRGRTEVETALGQNLEQGGQHAAMGTHNLLMSLGHDEYLEVIATDPDATAPATPRWFDLDRMRGPSRLGGWVMAVDDLDAALALAPAGAGRPVSLSRGDLSWRMAIPDSGVLPFDGVFPALIEWQGDTRPAPRLTDRQCRLKMLRLGHPEPDSLAQALAAFIDDPRIAIEHAQRGTLRAKIETPSGCWTLE